MTSTNTTTKFLKYNPLWVDSVFSTRSRTEQILSTERESGNLSARDYEAAVAFFPNYHRHLAIIGFLLGSVTPFAIRHPRVNARRPFIIAILGPLGFAIGGGLRMVSHANFLSSIQDPDGFQRAMDNVQRIYPPRSEAIMARAYTANNDDVDSPSNEGIILPSVNTDQMRIPVSKETPKPLTKWEELRRENSKLAPTSSWDSLRQTHEKQKIKPQENNSSKGGLVPDEFVPDEFRDSGDKYS